MLESVTITAETIEDAIQKGCQQLGLSQDQVDVRVINEGKKGFLGFGRQDAVVEISAKRQSSLSEMMANDLSVDKESSYNEREVSDDDQESDLVEQAVQASEITTLEDTSASHTTMVEDAVKVSEVTADQEQMTQVIDSTSSNVEVSDDDQEDDNHETVDSLSLEATSNIVADYLVEIIREYGAEATIDIDIQKTNVIFNIDTEKSGLIIGKHGKIINSLQILAQTLLHHHYKHRASVTLNVGDYRDRRANILEQMAQRTAEDVLRTKQPVILDSLPAYERKQIHAYLSKIDHISTHSEGKDPNRYLVVEYIND